MNVDGVWCFRPTFLANWQEHRNRFPLAFMLIFSAWCEKTDPFRHYSAIYKLETMRP
jgi:hypothetical protein